MRICVTTEERFEKTQDGSVWTPAAMPYSFWRRYLDPFEEVQVLARVQDATERNPAWKRADGERVSFAAVPYYAGLSQYAFRAWSIRRSIRRIVNPSDAVVLRVGSPIASAVGPMLRKGRPFGVELVADPYEVFAPGGVRHPMRPLLRRVLTAQLRRQCRHASTVAYVTERHLQSRYKPGNGAFTTHYSSIELTEESFIAEPRTYRPTSRTLRIASIGSMEQPYKGFDIAIDAVAICAQRGLGLQLVLVGDGRYRRDLEQRAARLGIRSKIRFTGMLASGSPVRAELDGADIFVLASRTEGLPRAMIEAMARGLPCIGSDAGGIPELLFTEDMFPPEDPGALAHKIQQIVTDTGRMNRMSERNLTKARDYHETKLRVRRRQFLDALRLQTEKWMQGRSA
ncbi:MAG TPA: glycosyltransferase family 4 protein [Bryobacteraceae bacterium]|nr:glycosyltransferase family 4 protein [Bryobacteraceae bacterium]